MRPSLDQLCLRHAPRSGVWPTDLSTLQIARLDTTEERVHSLHRPSVCFLVQGRKEAHIGSSIFRYGAGEFLVSSVDLPTTGVVVEATSRKPYLCLVLAIEPSLVFELASSMRWPASTRTHRAIFVGPSDPEMTGAFVRLMACLESPMDIQMLAPGIIREITYRLLRGPYGETVRELGVVGSGTQRIAVVIEKIKREYTKPLRTEELARTAGMSPSSLHDHFRKVTTLSPLQFQKRLRLQEARRLLLTQQESVADVGFTVGYESASQFSREYARLFGAPPTRDITEILDAKAVGRRKQAASRDVEEQREPARPRQRALR